MLVLPCSAAGFPFQLFRLLDPDEAHDVHAIPKCMRDELASFFLSKYATLEESQACPARAILEALAVTAEVDISRIECGHATVREYTMQRGRGHFASLVDVSAMFLCRFFGKLLKANSMVSGDLERPAKTKKREKPESAKPKKGGSGHGGPWHAFLADVAQGIKLNRCSIGKFSQMYHELTHDEYERYREIGEVAVLAARQGVKKPFAMPGPVSNHLVTTTGSTLAVLSSSQQEMLIALDGENFEKRYESFRQQLSRERLSLLKQKKNEDKESTNSLATSRSSVMENSARLRQVLSTQGHALPQHFSYAASSSSRSNSNSVLQQMEWVPPAKQFARVSKPKPSQ